MARKSRTPPPPRRVQAPKTRRDQRDRRGLALVVGAALVLALVAAAVAFFVLRNGESESQSVQEAMVAAGCTFRDIPALDAGVHISDPEATPEEWNTEPPTSGPHFGQWVIWGEYDEPVRPAEAVHNLEHGGIVMYYGDEVPEEQVTELRSFYRSDPPAMLLSPLPSLNDKIALTAWHAPDAEEGDLSTARAILAECTQFDEDAFETFRDAYRFEGPERIPPESLQPGS